MNRFAHVIARFASVLALCTADELAAAIAAFAEARTAQIDPRKPDALRPLDLSPLVRAVPSAYASDARELVRAAGEETTLRGQEWANAHMAQAIINFCPALGAACESATA
jgi:hypothetical protein